MKFKVAYEKTGKYQFYICGSTVGISKKDLKKILFAVKSALESTIKTQSDIVQSRGKGPKGTTAGGGVRPAPNDNLDMPACSMPKRRGYRPGARKNWFSKKLGDLEQVCIFVIETVGAGMVKKGK